MTDIKEMDTNTDKQSAQEPLKRNSVLVKVGSLKCQQEFQVELDELLQEAPLFKDQLSSNRVVSSGELVIPDITPRGFRNFLGYLTSGHISCSTVEECQETWEVASKYKITELDALITIVLSRLLSPSNACDVYNIAMRFSNSELQKKCLDAFSEFTCEVIKSSSFKRAKQEIVRRIMSGNNLSVSSELELFTALVEWGKEEAIRRSLSPTPDSLRVVLEPLLKHIRFLDITAAEFVLHVVPEQILTVPEERAVLIHLAVPNQTAIPIPNTLNRCLLPRMDNNYNVIHLSTASNNKLTPITIGATYQATLEATAGTFYLWQLLFPFKHESDLLHATVRVTFEISVINGKDKFVNRMVSRGPVTYVLNSYRFTCPSIKVREGECLSITADLVDLSASLCCVQCTPKEFPVTAKLLGGKVIKVTGSSTEKFSSVLVKY